MKKLRQYSSASERELQEKVVLLETRFKSLQDQSAIDRTTAQQQIVSGELSPLSAVQRNSGRFAHRT